MNYVDNAAAIWMASSGALRGAFPFELVPPIDGWLIGVVLLAAGCAVLLLVANPRRTLGRRRRTLRIVHGRAGRRRQPQHV